MKWHLMIGLLTAAAICLNASAAAADCITPVFGVRIVRESNDVSVYTAANARAVHLCAITDGPRCQTLISLAMAALLSRRQLRFSNGGGAGTCDEYVAGSDYFYVVLE